MVTNILSTQSQPTIMVGNQGVRQYLAHYFKSMPIKVEVDPLASKDIHLYVFGRDSRVCLPDGSHLIPYSIKDKYVEARYKAMLPASGAHFVSSPRRCYGEGFSAENNAAAIKFAEENHVKYRQARTCIEGGNCRLFSSKAIIGINSVILSLIALEEQDYFSALSKEEEKKVDEDKPSKETLRMARNLALYGKKEKENLSSYREKLLAPLTDKEELEYHKPALVLDHKLQATRSLMAKELGIEEDNIAFVDQYRFHIDMEIFTGKDDLVFLHRESDARAVLDNVGRGPKRFTATCAKYAKASKERSEAYDTLLSNNVKLIERIGCKTAFVPGVYEADAEEPINFMNGLFLSDKDSSVFATNASEYEIFQMQFEDTVKRIDSKMKTLFIDDPENPGMMQKILHNTRGGIHCLTWTLHTSGHTQTRPEGDKKLKSVP